MLGLGHSFQRKKDSNFGNGLKSCKCLCDNIHGETLGSKVLGMCVECEERKITLLHVVLYFDMHINVGVK